jgi:CxxC-x17-CxxC domain-containing protein
MGYQDRSIQCSDCGTTFTFSAEEQEQFASRGYTNDPKRCQSCRETRKSRNNGNGGNRGYSPRAPREMFDAVCAQCGKDTKVPFEPRSGRPVYCSNCYNQVRIAR